MSSGTTFEYLVIVPDKPGAQAKRLEVRAQHLAGIEPARAAGKWQMGGALFHETPQGGDPTKWDFMGSTLVCTAESKQEVIDGLSKDIYVQIYPFKCAFREQLN
ncbi:hypothetical protein NLU13_5604 [Sarocladium strictum]|uniref:YCII-related domain-containing protein n=1 Tax=Sarocladium strictum TaxID=5046 RepID=A0AA39GHI7_SARSR|nr:hypothetical protein NLU13_5604 [Sarocladium strictum]